MAMQFTYIAAMAVLSLLAGYGSPASAAVVLITQQKALAGSVTPGDPPGFPIEIKRPGVYRFDTDLTVPEGKQGIWIRHDNVTIDMAGFSLSGFDANGTRRGTIGIFGGAFGLVTVRSGIIMGFRLDGIRIANNQWVVEDVTISTNGGAGIYASNGSYARFINNAIYANGSTGILCSFFCHIEGNNVSSNGAYGIALNSGMVLGNTIFNNALSGIESSDTIYDIGFGNNTLFDNNGAAPNPVQVPDGLSELDPNACSLGC